MFQCDYQLIFIRIKYEAMKSQWKTIIAESQSDTNADVNNSTFDNNTLAGDEKEEGDAVTKIKERKYRIGMFYQ